MIGPRTIKKLSSGQGSYSSGTVTYYVLRNHGSLRIYCPCPFSQRGSPSIARTRRNNSPGENGGMCLFHDKKNIYILITPLINQVGKLRTSSHLQLRHGQDKAKQFDTYNDNICNMLFESVAYLSLITLVKLDSWGVKQIIYILIKESLEKVYDWLASMLLWYTQLLPTRGR